MGLLTPCFVPRGGFFALFKSCPEGGMVLDEIDTCIIVQKNRMIQIAPCERDLGCYFKGLREQNVNKDP